MTYISENDAPLMNLNNKAENNPFAKILKAKCENDDTQTAKKNVFFVEYLSDIGTNKIAPKTYPKKYTPLIAPTSVLINSHWFSIKGIAATKVENGTKLKTNIEVSKKTIGFFNEFSNLIPSQI